MTSVRDRGDQCLRFPCIMPLVSTEFFPILGKCPIDFERRVCRYLGTQEGLQTSGPHQRLEVMSPTVVGEIPVREVIASDVPGNCRP